MEKLIEDMDRLYLFVTDQNVDSMNSAVEGTLRHSIMARKINEGGRSEGNEGETDPQNLR